MFNVKNRDASCHMSRESLTVTEDFIRQARAMLVDASNAEPPVFLGDCAVTVSRLIRILQPLGLKSAEVHMCAKCVLRV
jgi:hypothetical protein